MGDLPETGDGDDAAAPQIAGAVADFHWAARLTIVFPLLLDAPPPGLCALLTRAADEDGVRAAGIVVTMSLPGFLLRANYRCARDAPNPIALPGIAAGRPTFIGSVETLSDTQRRRWLTTLQEQARKALSSTHSPCSPKKLSWAGTVPPTHAHAH